MVELFVFTWAEVATSLRLAAVVGVTLTTAVISLIVASETRDAIRYGIFVLRKVDGIPPKEYFKFIRYCYVESKHGVQRTWADGSYWYGFDNWGYYDKKKGEWVQKPKNKQDDEQQEE